MASKRLASGQGASSMLAAIARREAPAARLRPPRAATPSARLYSSSSFHSPLRSSLYVSPHRREAPDAARLALLASSRQLSLSSFGFGGKPKQQPPTEQLHEPIPPPESAAPPPETAAPVDSLSATSPPLDGFTDASSSALSNATGAVQELAALDIEHGFIGRILSANAEWLLCQIHDLTSLPWIWSIPVTVVAIRLILVRLQIEAMNVNVRNMLAKPVIEGKVKEIRDFQRAGRSAQANQAQKELQGAIQETGFSAFGMFKFPLAQGIIFSTMFFAFKNMGEAGLPSMMTEGALWFVDMTQPGVAYGLPLIASALTLTTIETAAEMGGVQNQQAQGMRWGFRALIFAMFWVFYQLPSVMFVFWVTNNLCTLFWAIFARKAPESIRPILGMPSQASLDQVKAVNAQQAAAQGLGGKPAGFMESIRAMQQQAIKAREEAERAQRAPSQVIQATPIPPRTNASSTDFYEQPSATSSFTSPETPSNERTAHGAYNVESPAGHAEGAEVGSGVQVGEVPPAPSAGQAAGKRRFGKAIKDAPSIDRARR